MKQVWTWLPLYHEEKSGWIVTLNWRDMTPDEQYLLGLGLLIKSNYWRKWSIEP